VRQESEKDPFAIALAISSPNGYKSANFAEMLAIGTFSMTYLITGGAEDGKTFDIQFVRCTDNDWDKFHLRHFSGRQNTIIESHIKHDVFWCPDASDLSFWGHVGDQDSKILTVNFEYTDSAALEGKKMLLLLNNRVMHYEEKDGGEQELYVEAHTSMYWLPVVASAPQLTTLTYTRERLYESLDEKARLMGDAYPKEDFLSLRPENIQMTPYNQQTTNPNVGASIEFQLSYDLFIES